MAKEEKRQAERFELRAPALVEWSATEPGEGCLFLLTRNLSGGGVYFQGARKPEMNTELKVGIFLDVSHLERFPVDGHVFLQANATVLRVEPEGMAVRFLDQCQVLSLDEEDSAESA